MANSKHTLHDVLFAGPHIRLVRVHRPGREDSRLLKTPLENAADPFANQLLHEYRMCKDLDVAGLLRPVATDHVNGRLAVYFEDPGGLCLVQWLNAGPVDVSTFFSVAIELTGIISRLHRTGIVHKDIHAGNILVCTQSDPVRVYLTGLGISSLLSGQRVEKSTPDQLEGTLEVMSPEQTGRMNRPLDYRTDYYSLGVVFYQMLTAKLPFAGDDPLALVHAHLAIKPQPPSAIDAHIPPVLSDLVLKLLAKDADDRYRSAAGIVADLKRCRDEWHRNNTIAPFRLGSQDLSETFRIPDKLYGRDAQMRILESAFERVCEGSVETVSVKGPAGIGKTELIQQLRGLIAEKRGFLISGKCDLLDRKIPCAPFIEALTDGVSQALASPRKDFIAFRKNLSLQLGRQGRVLTDVIPLLAHITGEQPPVPELPPDQARHRFHMMVLRLFGAATMRGRPFVLFLDDLQWADYSTLKMLEILACDKRLHHVLVVGAFRGEQNDVPRNLRDLYSGIEMAGAHLQTICLGPLTTEAINLMITDAFQAPPEATQPLAALCFQKTGGNPFFLKRFLLEMAKRKLIFFDTARRRWQWRTAKIARTNVTENVVELMARTIAGLDGNVRSVIRSAACIGSRFDLGTLSDVNDIGPEKLLKDLWSAVQSSLISLLPVPGVRLAVGPGGTVMPSAIAADAEVEQICFVFTHDRIQEAAYGLMDYDSKMDMHLRLGRLMLAKCHPKHLEENIFDILGQLNRAVPLITQTKELERLAALNLQAGQKARSMALFESAFDYFHMGIGLTAEQGWQRQYELTRELHLKGIEAAFVSGRYSEMDAWFEAAVKHISSPLDVVDAYITIIEKETTNANFQNAVDYGLAVLSRLDIHVPLHPTAAEMVSELEETEKLLGRFTVEEILHLPTMKDPHYLAVFRILDAVSHATFFVNRGLYILSILKGVRLMLRHGNNDLSAQLMCIYASVLTLFPERHANVAKYGRIGIRLLDRQENSLYSVSPRYYFVTAVKAFVDPFDKAIAAMKELHHDCVATGSLMHGGNSLFIHELMGFFTGQPLGRVAAQMSASRERLEEIHHDNGMILLDLHRQLVLNLMGESEHNVFLHGPVFDARIYLPVAQQTQNETFLVGIYVCQMMLAYYFERFEEAIELAENVANSLYVPPMPWYMARCHFYAALARTAMFPTNDESPDGALLAKVVVNLQWLQSFTDQAPMNFVHMLHLIQAELDRVEGRLFEAQEHYDRAIELSQESGYLQDQALANELAAKFWMSREKESIARLYMQQASELYTRWGATAKVRHLKENHPEFFDKAGGATVDAPQSLHPHRAEELDVMSALHASRAISGEIVLERLIEKLMAVVIENAGATSGRLLLEKDGALHVMGETDADPSGKVRAPGEAVVAQQAAHLVPLQVIQYVMRTGTPMVLDHAAMHELFARDPYILEKKPRSVLCSPIVRKEKVIGLFYLENNLAAGTFTAERLKMLDILSAQIAVSLENARLYESQLLAELELKKHRDHLEELVNERTMQLAEAKEQAEAANRSKSAFLANMSHEIRTPMNAVIGFTDRMLATTLSRQQQGYLQAVKEGGHTLLHLIDDILDLSKIEAGKMDLEPVDFDPERAVWDVCHLIGPRLVDKPVELLLRVDCELPAVVKGDLDKFKQVLINLLSNAAKFTESGEIEIRLKALRRQNQDVELQTTVRDTGIGIAPDQLEKIFTAFEQADGTITRRFGGTGLGLAISKKLATLLDGELRVKSAMGQGSRFQFTARMQAVKDIAETGAIDTRALKGKKVLIADDNDKSLAIAADYLKHIKMRVTAADKSMDIVSLLLKGAEENDPFDICLLNIQKRHPDIDTVIKRVRRMAEPVRSTPLLALFSLAQDGSQRFEDAGLDGFITKPVMRTELYHKIQRLLGIGPPQTQDFAVSSQGAAKEKPKPSARILLVEDTEINRMLAEEILSSSGYRVQSAENGQLALDAYTQDPDAVDLILMDVQMPVMDGLAATLEIRRWEAKADPAGKKYRVPIVAMTANALKGDREKCLQAGMDDYIAKPINHEKVLKIVSELVGAFRPKLKKT